MGIQGLFGDSGPFWGFGAFLGIRGLFGDLGPFWGFGAFFGDLRSFWGFGAFLGIWGLFRGFAAFFRDLRPFHGFTDSWPTRGAKGANEPPGELSLPDILKLMYLVSVRAKYRVYLICAL